MITIKLSEQKPHQIDSGAYVFFFSKDYSFSPSLNAFSAEMCPDMAQMLDHAQFTGAVGQARALSVMHDGRLVHIVCVGIGGSYDDKHEALEQYRRALGHAVRKLKYLKVESAVLTLPSVRTVGATAEQLAQETALIANMANYHFDEYITDKDARETHVCDLQICIDAKQKVAMRSGIRTGETVAMGVNRARLWIDTPPSLLTPPDLTSKAEEIAKQDGLKITTFTEKQIIAMGMGGLAGVARGSNLDARLLIMEYAAPRKNAPTLAFVGKGITFDSGGLSIKPAVHMETMKEDMSGAAAVIATMGVLSKLKPKVNVIGVTPLAENLPGGDALKPGDIIRFYNGKTAEVRNTDAEGRLILADALAYAVEKYRPDAIVDIATLTGACAYALGPFFSGLMTQHDDLARVLQDVGARSGDRVWRLPMHNDYAKAIQSPVSDICNIGNAKYMAGAITAGHFLKHFVGDTPWAHIDIAGTAFNVPDMPYFRPGATGVGVRLLTELAMSWG